ncbi:hypothetical protein [Cystobacter ferrugineus]|uniref:hypothetical protein n=1 Tax=Cystobacter ferrugineus TaxID=83449 RepID=UPI0009FFECA7|nr:hypothetical protein [Cystobacter ferrugineus]
MHLLSRLPMRLPCSSLLLASSLLLLSACGEEPVAAPPATPIQDPQPPTDPEPGPARPFVTSASVDEGARDVYPLELFDDVEAGPRPLTMRKRFSVTFNTAMKTAVATVTLLDRSGADVPPRPLTGTWSDDARTLHVTVPEPAGVVPPLEEETAYALDLTALRGAEADAPLDPAVFLGDGALDFTTSARDWDLEHACFHALRNEPRVVEAAAHLPEQGFPPPTDRGHARYRVKLPDAPQGYTELVSRPSGDEDIVLYLDQGLVVGAVDAETNAELTVETRPAPPACTGISHVASFPVQGGERGYYLRFTGTPASTFDFVLERHAHQTPETN